MSKDFSTSLEGLLQRTSPRAARQPKPVAAEKSATAKTEATEQCREWFAGFAANQVMPLLDEAAEKARKHGATATSRLAETNGKLAAELELIRGHLPKNARPPRLTIYATDGEPPLMVEFTGTFPHVGALGGWGGEVDYDSVYPSQLEEKILDFIALASGAGTPLT